MELAVLSTWFCDNVLSGGSTLKDWMALPRDEKAQLCHDTPLDAGLERVQLFCEHVWESYEADAAQIAPALRLALSLATACGPKRVKWIDGNQTA